MKCLIFIFTLCSIGTFIDGQSETDLDTEPAQSEVNQPEESSKEDEKNSPSETSNNSEGESGNVEPREVLIMVPMDPKDKKDKSKKLQSDTDTDTESTLFEVNQPEESSEEDENNNPSEASNSSEDESGNVETKDGDPEDKKDKETKLEVMKLYMDEVEAGDMADLIGQNQHIQQSHVYNDLGRRSEPQGLKNNEAETPDYLIPEKAPPKLVLLVAKESRLLRAGKDNDLDDFDRDKLLRSGNYWDGYWKEEVIPKNVMRSAPLEKQLGSIKVKINPGTEFYKVVSRMKKISPKLLYIINKN